MTATTLPPTPPDGIATADTTPPPHIEDLLREMRFRLLVKRALRKARS